MSDELTERDLAAVHDLVDRWYHAFTKRPAFAALTESQQREACAITDFFTEYSFRHLDLAPAEWNCDAVCECCIEILPRKVTAELCFFEAIAPVLGAFFRFLGDESLHPQGHALADTVEDTADDIVSSARDSSNWGPAKQLAMSAIAAGVNLGDQAELNAFILLHNERLASRFMSSGPPPPTPPSSANPYDPCPCGSGKKFKFCCRQQQVDRSGARYSPSPGF